MNAPVVRLTSLAHGGGCGCKLAPSVLEDLISGLPSGGPFQDLLVGIETGDDAAVHRIEGDTCVIATTDFFLPVVDDPFDFGRIAATNAISDVYAMGGRPLMALAILGIPVGKIPTEAVREILRGGAEVCSAAGIMVAGGHSIDVPEPVYGLAVIGACKVDEIRRNATARPGDVLILTKGLGIGVYSAALRKGALSPEGYAEMVASTTLLNRIGGDLGREAAVHAMTDVTGFGLLGHALEMARGAGHRVMLDAAAVPLLAEAAALAEAGFITGASGRNWASYGHAVSVPAGLPTWRRDLLTDPQTSGGLLVAVAAGEADHLLGVIRTAGYPLSTIVGRVEAGAAGVAVV
jgi:selenide,water dikinase